ncbi:hypothetical protein CC80DRAFT_567917 [Byssothecium circinans]|uniref:ATP-dependent DNA ligase family profile domain-containing protein n=1 Tax=Byssothecium circinans TaxID=147558 RepID=A0A6A5TMM2_9PLEO|nr:hypothetical protein CC80DRAFT_567917 [Byssothecium circinans]
MTLTFNDTCSLLEAVEKISIRKPRLPPKEEKEEVVHKIEQTIRKWFKTHRQTLDSPETNGAAILSTLFPHRRKDRVYGLQPPALSKKLLKLLDLNHGNRTLFARWATDSRRDLGFYAKEATKPWDGSLMIKRQFSIDRIDKLLTQMAAKYRFSDMAIRKQRDLDMDIDMELAHILKRLESWELKWLVRLILREYTTIELDEACVFRCYHFLLPDLLKFQNDFDAAFRLLREEFKDYPSVPEPSLERSMREEAAGRLKAAIGVKVARPTFHKAWSFKHCLQLVGDRAWAAEVKYDGEYCEIHVNLDSTPDDIKIFSKNGKDATADRALLHDTIRQALRIGQSDCIIKHKCIVLGEMVLYSDKEEKILPFSKIRKHISRSGSFLGTLQDSLPHEWEHLMLVYFDVIMLDDESIMHRCLQDRRTVLRELITIVPGRSQRSEWTLLDFKSGYGSTDLAQAFARTIAHRQEGLVLKPLHSPYLSLCSGVYQWRPNYFVKVKKDYLADMGGERDLGDFAVIGARYDPQVASKTNVRPLLWTHFYLGCLLNTLGVERHQERPKFKVVGCLSLDKCIPKPELKYLNERGQFQKIVLHQNGSIDAFDIDHSSGYDRRMSVAFKKPFVAEILGGGFEKLQNETFEMLRHPRIKKIHHDRTWEDAVTMDGLQQMAEQKWEVPNADRLDGLAKDVAVYAQKYLRDLGYSQALTSEYDTTQETTQQSSRPAQGRVQHTPDDDEVPETQEPIETCTTCDSVQFSSSTQGMGLRASREMQVLVREDTSERLSTMATTVAQTSTVGVTAKTSKRSFAEETVSPPARKRKKISPQMRSPLEISGGNRKLGTFEYDSQERVIRIYAEEGWEVEVNNSPRKSG